jgi:hypothetical protein
VLSLIEKVFLLRISLLLLTFVLLFSTFSLTAVFLSKLFFYLFCLSFQNTRKLLHFSAVFIRQWCSQLLKEPLYDIECRQTSHKQNFHFQFSFLFFTTLFILLKPSFLSSSSSLSSSRPCLTVVACKVF